MLKILQQLKIYEIERLAKVVAGIPPFLWWWVVPGVVGVVAVVWFFSAFRWKTRAIFRVAGALGAAAFLWTYVNILAASMVAWGYRYLAWWKYWHRPVRCVSLCLAYHHHESCLIAALYGAFIRLAISTVLVGIAAAVIALVARWLRPKKTISS